MSGLRPQRLMRLYLYPLRRSVMLPGPAWLIEALGEVTEDGGCGSSRKGAPAGLESGGGLQRLGEVVEAGVTYRRRDGQLSIAVE
jgi:hypothetical protein